MLASIEDRRAAIAARFPVWRPDTLDGFLAQTATAYPDRPFILTDEASWSYRDVAQRAEALARGLRKLGVQRGDRVALVMANLPEFAPIVYAVWRLGASVIPVNFLFKADELAYVVGQSNCRLVITMDAFRGNDYLASLDAIAPGWESGRTARFPELRGVVVHGGNRAGVTSLDDVAALGRGDVSALPANPAQPTDPAVIMYTSGTTGQPKGVIQSHDNLARSAFCCSHHMAAEDGRRTLTALPLYHAFALVVGLLAMPFVGGAMIPQLIFDPAATLAGIEKHRASFLMCVPTMSVALAEHPDIGRYDLSSNIAILSAAAPSPVWLWQQLKDRLGFKEVFTGYGMTETSSATVMTKPDDPLEIVATTVGGPMVAGAAGGADLDGLIAVYKTIDPATGADLPEGVEGELCSRGPTSTVGYFAKPAETAALLMPGGWIRSGDLGRVLANGSIQLTGRSKELFKSGGELVAPKEIEDLLTGHPAVGQAYAIGVPDDRWGEIGCAWIVPSPGKSVSEGELLALAREKLARFKVPKHILFAKVEELPTTATGKVQKFRLVEMAKQRLGRR